MKSRGPSIFIVSWPSSEPATFTTEIRALQDRHRTVQHELFRLSKVRSAARVAASNTSSTPSPVKEEHSRYLLAPTCAAISLPSLAVTNRRDFFLISSIARGSSRRSFFNPTNIMGTPGHRSWASSIHYTCVLVDGYKSRSERWQTLSFTFSIESGVSTANPIKITWAFEYASGRNRS